MSSTRPHEAPFSAGGRRAARAGGQDDGHDPAESGGTETDGNGRSVLLANVARDARLDQKYLLLITLSAAIATLGLLQSSAAVVIGAMLVSPLLGPIMGIGFGLATLDSGLIKRALTTLAAGMAVAILVAMVLVWLSPVQDVTAELRARTQPTLLDLGVAVVGGIAGVYAILRRLSGVMVGVAIATALVPPLSTVGFGLATARPEMALGAALLFLTNTLAIAFAATIIARINRFGPSLTPQHTVLQVAGIVLVLGVLSIPLGLSLNRLVREAGARSAVQGALSGLIGKNDRIDELTAQIADGVVHVDGVLLVGRYNPQLPRQLEARAGKALGRPVEASLVQLRQESNSGAERQDQIDRRLTALESRDGEAETLLAALTVGQLIARDRILIDPQARRIVIERPAQGEAAEVAAAVDRVIAAAQATQPAWRITTVAANTGAAGP